MNIAVTGTIGSGKSCVAAILASGLAATLIDTDQLCRDLLGPGNDGWVAVREKWADLFINREGQIDRSLLREALSADQEIRNGLEAILHPLVRLRVEAVCTECSRLKLHAVVEVPLLFEAGWQDDFDHSVSVYLPLPICIQRTIARDAVSIAQTERILAIQKSPEAKAALADSVIDNSGLWVATALQASRLVNQFRNDPRDQ